MDRFCILFLTLFSVISSLINGSIVNPNRIDIGGYKALAVSLDANRNGLIVGENSNDNCLTLNAC